MIIAGTHSQMSPVASPTVATNFLALAQHSISSPLISTSILANQEVGASVDYPGPGSAQRRSSVETQSSPADANALLDWLDQGFPQTKKQDEGCRVENGILFELLDLSAVFRMNLL